MGGRVVAILPSAPSTAGLPAERAAIRLVEVKMVVMGAIEIR